MQSCDLCHAQVSQLCATFLRWRLPGVWAYALFSSIQGFLQAQRIVNPPAVGNLLSALLHPAVTHLLINTVGEPCLALYCCSSPPDRL